MATPSLAAHPGEGWTAFRTDSRVLTSWRHHGSCCTLGQFPVVATHILRHSSHFGLPTQTIPKPTTINHYVFSFQKFIELFNINVDSYLTLLYNICKCSSYYVSPMQGRIHDFHILGGPSQHISAAGKNGEGKKCKMRVLGGGVPTTPGSATYLYGLCKVKAFYHISLSFHHTP